MDGFYSVFDLDGAEFLDLEDFEAVKNDFLFSHDQFRRDSYKVTPIVIRQVGRHSLIGLIFPECMFGEFLIMKKVMLFLEIFAFFFLDFFEKCIKTRVFKIIQGYRISSFNILLTAGKH